MKHGMLLAGLMLPLLSAVRPQTTPPPAPYFQIRVIDAQTGRGVPLVTLRTTNELACVTDSNGIVAFNEPGLMRQKVFFTVTSDGYDFPADHFGYHGAALTPLAGGHAVLTLTRRNIAERICRLTGEGIYSDSLLTGASVPLRSPALSGHVMGQDTAFAVMYRGRMLWFWGDTARPSYPLGNFRTTGAVASLPAGHTGADAGLDYRYFTDADGDPKAMCPTTQPGPIWISGLTTAGKTADAPLFAYYARMESLDKKREHGWVRWDDVQNQFRFVKTLPLDEPWRFLEGHPIQQSENGVDYLMGGFTYPVVRVRNDPKALLDTAQYEAYTCLTPKGDIVRDAAGHALYRWQKEAPPITPQREAELVRQGKLKLDEAHFLPLDAQGSPALGHGGSVTWNPWRRKWLLIATQQDGKPSSLGEIVYAEADDPCGPWRRAVKILTHEKYTFYNPVHHPFLDQEGGRLIYFEGTYTAEFSGNPHLTPRYNYNQILYRLNLDDPHLKSARTPEHP